MKLRLPNPFDKRSTLVLAPLPGFDPIYYLFWYPDVRAAGLDPLQHYLLVGWKEGRDPSGGFSTSGYLRANPDVAVMELCPLVHFVNAGLAEGRKGFDKDPSASAPRPNSDPSPQKLLPPPVATSAEPLQGFLDEVTHTHVRGWALPASVREHHAEIEIFANGRLIAFSGANQRRDDLINERIGTGFHGFKIKLHPSLPTTMDHAIIVRRKVDGYEIGAHILPANPQLSDRII